MIAQKTLLKDKRGQLITGLVSGIVGLIILVIISFLIVDTMNTSITYLPSSVSVTNESLTTVYETGEYLATAYESPTCTVTQCVNGSNGYLIPSANWTATNCLVAYTGTGEDEIGVNNTDWKCDYSATYSSFMTVTTDSFISNYTKGVDNVSSKIPTVLLVAAVVLLFGAIVLLVSRSRDTVGSVGTGL